jgi:hypothetical protein
MPDLNTHLHRVSEVDEPVTSPEDMAWTALLVVLGVVTFGAFAMFIYSAWPLIESAWK